MRCHEILGIDEMSSEEAISEAYLRKAAALGEAASLLPQEAYERKCEELDSALSDCLSWRLKDGGEKFAERMETAKKKSKPVRLYATCIGPFTCTDQCCAAVNSECCCGPREESCCAGTFGAPNLPIVADILCWIFVVIEGIEEWIGWVEVFGALRDAGEWIGEQVKALARRKTDKEIGRRRLENQQLSEEVNTLNEKLNNVNKAIEEDTKEIEDREKEKKELEAFHLLFSSMGAENTELPLQNTEIRLQELHTDLDTREEWANGLKEEIESRNQMIRNNDSFIIANSR